MAALTLLSCDDTSSASCSRRGVNCCTVHLLQGEDSPLRAQAAKALQAVKSGAEQIGLDPRTLRKQVPWVQ